MLAQHWVLVHAPAALMTIVFLVFVMSKAGFWHHSWDLDLDVVRMSITFSSGTFGPTCVFGFGKLEKMDG